MARDPVSIIRDVSRLYGVLSHHVMGSRPRPSVMIARREACREIMAEHPEMDMRQIGELFGLAPGGARWLMKQVECSPVAPVYPTPDEIALSVLKGTKYTLSDMRGSCRIRKVTATRHAVICALREQRPSMAITEIGDYMRRDHTTVLHALRCARNRGSVSEQLAA